MDLRVRATVVCIFQDKILGFKAVDPYSKRNYIFLPGGKIENGETPEVCGERETWEETGYKVRVDSQSLIFRKYIFNWNGKDHFCETYFYRATLVSDFSSPQMTRDQDYNKGYVWVPLQEIPIHFNYHPEILRVTLQLSKLPAKD